VRATLFVRFNAPDFLLAERAQCDYLLPMAACVQGAQRYVLIVDDDEDSRMLLDELLQASGHRTITAACAADVMNSWNSGERPDLAFIDLSLPDADGCEVARSLRERAGSSIRLVALTGFSDPGTRRAAEDAGFDRYVVKPLMPTTLDALLTER
jgi:CheY-like chemotaxis protein